jgi:hypothetical protein
LPRWQSVRPSPIGYSQSGEKGEKRRSSGLQGVRSIGSGGPALHSKEEEKRNKNYFVPNRREKTLIQNAFNFLLLLLQNPKLLNQNTQNYKQNNGKRKLGRRRRRHRQ